ncbi:TetR/AcrR family transcriptional regulator [Desulfosudis oleivorans]|uniref:Transcriptional regulator, TetR family n=1 Tax=Desulfosudis oleivorans (strain DSM 6200 / JCM 39069 / Hxd3) TaxID=96561 RepID=A8ZT60_DESOH|nr:TetR/AcrR family transcriptional regulator [Desulfosudis oleivorans]ABW67743.1 transcriptional regulator, TetR family [Desulfosudis oleivorans Hxd3]
MSENNHRRPRKKPRQERAKVTVDAIYEAALQLFVIDNYSAVTTDKIAERAGVSIGTLYQYFPNKESILVGLWDQVFDAVVIGDTTHSLHGSEITEEEKVPEQDGSVADENGLKRIAGVYIGTYTGVLAGTIEGAIFNIKHRFKFRSTWRFDLDEESVKLVLENLPVIERIAGTGTLDPPTGFMKMVFQAPIMGKLPGTGWFDGGNFSFSIPRVDFAISGVFASDGLASGTWKFNISFVVLKVSAKGDMSGELKRTNA